MDPNKLDKMKVVELRAELQARGLDTKGVKAVLVERLKAALESEIGSGAEEEKSNSSEEQSEPEEVKEIEKSPRTRRSRRSRGSPSPSPTKQSHREEVDEEQIESILPDDEVDNSLQTLNQSKIQEEPEKYRDPAYVAYEEEEEEEEEEEKKMPVTVTKQSSPIKVTPTPVEEVKTIKTPAERKQIEPSPFENEQKQQMITKESSLEVSDAAGNEDTSSSESFQQQEEPQKQQQQQEQQQIQQLEEAFEEKSEIDEANKDVCDKNNETIEDEWPLNKSTENEPMDVQDSVQEKTNEKTVDDKPKEESRKRPRSRSRSLSKSRSVSKSRSRSKSKSRSMSRSRTRSRSPRRTKRKSPAPNIDDFTNEEDEPVVEDKQFGLSWFDSDLHLRIDPVAFNSAKPLNEDIFGLIWSGARSNYGIRHGKVMYEVRLAEELEASNFRTEDHLLGFRVGFSLANTNLQLGEAENSFAYCSTGKKVTNSEFTDYSKPYKLDDVIGCYLDLDSTPCRIHFTLNGEDLGTAFEFEKEILGENEALFPHVLTKGYEFQVNFADNENLLGNIEPPKRTQRKRERSHSNEEKSESKEKTKEQTQKSSDSNNDKEGEENWDDNDDNDGDDNKKKKPTEQDKEGEKENENNENNDKMDTDEIKKSDVNESINENIQSEPRVPVQLLPGYQLIALIPEDQYIPGPQRPESRKNCEVLLMVGLPGAGKTHWVKNYIKEHSQQKFDIIGVDALFEKMKVDEKSRKECHSGKWEKVYDYSVKSLATLEDIATKRRRNYILDQPNVFASDQRRKMKGFGDFKRIAVVCVPKFEEYKRRFEMMKSDDIHGYKEMFKDSTINRMKANFTLPSLEFGWFDEIRFTDLDGDDVKDEVHEYNEKGKKAVEANDPSRYKRPRYDNYRRDDRRFRDDRRRYDDRGWKYNDRRNNRWGGRGGGGGSYWRDDRGYGGSNYDRRDRYGSGGGGGGGGSGASSWVQNKRDRFYGSSSSSSNRRYDYGGSGGGRDYRDRYDRDRNGSSSSSGRRNEGSSSSASNRRDFRSGHRDSRSEDSRGGYERSSSKYSSSNYNDHKHSSSSSKSGRGDSSSNSKSTNHSSSSHHKQQSQQPEQWDTPQTQQGTQQMHQDWSSVAVNQQGYWNYDQNNYSVYGNHQQQWPINSADPRQQQWMNWWQQQQNSGVMADGNQQQYWAGYTQASAYSQQPQQSSEIGTGGDNGNHSSNGTRNDSKN